MLRARDSAHTDIFEPAIPQRNTRIFDHRPGRAGQVVQSGGRTISEVLKPISLAGARRRGSCRNLFPVLAALLVGSAFGQPVTTDTTGTLAYRAYKTKITSDTSTVLIDYSTTDSKLVTVTQREKAFYQFEQPNGLPAPLTVVGASNYYTVEIEPDPPVITNQIPDSLQDWKVITDYATSQTIPDAWVYRINPEYGFETANGSRYGDSATIKGSLIVEVDEIILGALTVTGNIRSYNGTLVALTEGGSFSTPQVQAISTMAGGVAGTNVGANEDIHAGISGYANRSFVAGRGAQHFGHDGAYVVTTNGSGTAPYVGFARGTIWSDRQGMRLQVLESTPPYVGSDGNWLLTDATFATSGSLETSNTLNIGATHEGQATIASGNTSILVNDGDITATDVVLVGYAGAANSGAALYYDAIVANTSFTIRSTGAVTTNTVVNWKIIH